MSHIVTAVVKLEDRAALQKALERLEIKTKEGKHRLYQTDVEGLGIYLKGWAFPLVLTDQNELKYDSYMSGPNAMQELEKLTDVYGVEKCKLECIKKGYSYYEQAEQDGSIKLTVEIGEEAVA